MQTLVCHNFRHARAPATVNGTLRIPSTDRHAPTPVPARRQRYDRDARALRERRSYQRRSPSHAVCNEHHDDMRRSSGVIFPAHEPHRITPHTFVPTAGENGPETQALEAMQKCCALSLAPAMLCRTECRSQSMQNGQRWHRQKDLSASLNDHSLGWC